MTKETKEKKLPLQPEYLARIATLNVEHRYHQLLPIDEI